MKMVERGEEESRRNEKKEEREDRRKNIKLINVFFLKFNN